MSLKNAFDAAKQIARTAKEWTSEIAEIIPSFVSGVNESADSLAKETGKSKPEAVITVIKAVLALGKGMNP
jgi:hypothetical protein